MKKTVTVLLLIFTICLGVVGCNAGPQIKEGGLYVSPNWHTSILFSLNTNHCTLSIDGKSADVTYEMKGNDIYVNYNNMDFTYDPDRDVLIYHASSGDQIWKKL